MNDVIDVSPAAPKTYPRTRESLRTIGHISYGCTPSSPSAR